MDLSQLKVKYHPIFKNVYVFDLDPVKVYIRLRNSWISKKIDNMQFKWN